MKDVIDRLEVVAYYLRHFTTEQAAAQLIDQIRVDLMLTHPEAI